MNLYLYLLREAWGTNVQIYISARDAENAKRIGDKIQAAMETAADYSAAVAHAKEFVARSEAKEEEKCSG